MKICNRIEIKASPERVFYWLEDPGRAMQWMTSVTKTELIRETPNRIGSTFREYVEEDGRGTEMHGVVTDFVLNKRLSFNLEGDFNTAEVDFILEAEGDITRLTQDAEVRFKGILRFLIFLTGPFLKRKIMRQAQSEFARLKELCEQDI